MATDFIKKERIGFLQYKEIDRGHKKIEAYKFKMDMDR